MNPILCFAVAALLGAANDPTDRATRAPGASFSLPPGTPLQAPPLETPAAEVCLGDVAPNVSFQGVDGRWRHLRDLVRETPVLLVFGADELTLRVIEHERESLLDLGVLPVVVVGSRAGAARATVKRLDLRFTVLADPQGAIASQFNAVDPATGRHLPAWFVLDTKRRVKGLGRRGLPLRGYPALVAEALGLPAKITAVPLSR